MSIKIKRLLIAFLFLVLTIMAIVSMLRNGVTTSMTLYAVTFGGICILFVKNALRP